MATTSKKAARPNPHTAVSNQPHETESAIKKAVTVPPAEGTNPKTAKPGPGGAEAVPGFKLAREAASGGGLQGSRNVIAQRHRRGLVRSAAASGGDGSRLR